MHTEEHRIGDFIVMLSIVGKTCRFRVMSGAQRSDDRCYSVNCIGGRQLRCPALQEQEVVASSGIDDTTTGVAEVAKEQGCALMTYRTGGSYVEDRQAVRLYVDDTGRRHGGACRLCRLKVWRMLNRRRDWSVLRS